MSSLYKRDLSCLIGIPYQLERCDDCSCIYQRYIGDGEFLTELYTKWVKDIVADNPSGFKPWKRILTRPHRSRDGHEIMMVASFLRKPLHSLKTLDYGMGFGIWAQVAHKLGCQSYGLELAEPRAAYAEERGVRLVRHHDDLAAGDFDYVNTEQVFEHLPDPLEIAKTLARSLAPGGLLKISVPSGEDLMRRLAKGDWTAPKYSRNSLNAVYPLQHINAFTRRTIEALGRAVGLEVVSIAFRHRLAFLSSAQATPLSPKDLVISLARTWYRFHNRNNLYVWLRRLPGGPHTK